MPPPPPPAGSFASRIFLGPALRAQPDRRLVALVRDGYENAFEEIVRRYNAGLRRFAASIVPSHRADDVMQDAFSKALLALRDTDKEIELRPWLFRIVRNTALNDLRDEPAYASELTDRPDSVNDPAMTAERREELVELMDRLRALPEPQRAAIVMRELEGLSHEEIAAALGMSGGAARQAIYRARRSLREGVGALLPIPLLHYLLAGGAAGGAAAAGAGGAAAGGALASAAGGGVALKTGIATVVVAGSVTAGVAIDRDRGERQRASDTPAASLVSGNVPGAEAAGSSGRGGSSGSSGPGGGGDNGGSGGGPQGRGDDRGRGDGGDGRGRGEPGRGGDDDDRGGEGRGDDERGGGDEDSSGQGPGGGSGSSGSGSGSDDDADSSGPGGGGDGSGGGGGDDDTSGSGSGGSGSGGGGGSGSGGGNSGSGGGGNSGSGSSGSSGSGSSGAGSSDTAPGAIVRETVGSNSGRGSGRDDDLDDGDD